MNSICKYLILFRQPPETQIYFLIMKIEKGKKNPQKTFQAGKARIKEKCIFFSLLLLCCCQTGKLNHVEKIKKNMGGRFVLTKK